MRHKQYTVIKSSVTCDHQTGLTKKRLGGHGRGVHKQKRKKVSMHGCTLTTKKKLVWGGRKPFTAISIAISSEMPLYTFARQNPKFSLTMLLLLANPGEEGLINL